MKLRDMQANRSKLLPVSMAALPAPPHPARIAREIRMAKFFMGVLSGAMWSVHIIGIAICSRNSGTDQLASTTIVGHALFRYPDVLRSRSGLEEYVDGNTATWIPIAADPEPFRLQKLHEALTDGHGTVFVERAVIAEGEKKQFQGFAFHQPLPWNIVDHQMREIRLACHWAERGEFRRGEANTIRRSSLRICHPFQDGFLRRLRYRSA